VWNFSQILTFIIDQKGFGVGSFTDYFFGFLMFLPLLFFTPVVIYLIISVVVYLIKLFK